MNLQKFNINGHDIYLIPDEIRASYLIKHNGSQHNKINLLKELNNKYNYLKFIDIGANYGEFSVAMSSLIDDIDCYEPGPIVKQALQKTVSLYKNISYFDFPISSDDSIVKFYFDKNGSTGASSLFSGVPKYANHHHNIDYISCESKSLDSLYTNLNDTLIKIDTEGSENLIIKDSRLVKESKNCSILFEYNIKAIQTHSSLDQWWEEICVLPFTYQLFNNKLVPIINKPNIQFGECEVLISTEKIV